MSSSKSPRVYWSKLSSWCVSVAGLMAEERDGWTQLDVTSRISTYLCCHFKSTVKPNVTGAGMCYSLWGRGTLYFEL